ncbi:MAG: methionine--tRNA ligase subunit beta, partial [Clostridia bacterium]|nr:methionine--tRNA ligase subunit beta [Clostridia bacterium]
KKLYAPEVREAVDDELKAFAENTVKEVEAKMEELRVADALEAIISLARRSNKYIDETAPWVLAKDENGKERLKAVMYNLIESIRIIAICLESFMPETAKKIYEQIGATKTDWESAKVFGATEPGTSVGTAVPMFARMDEKKKLEEIEAFNLKKYPKKEEKKAAKKEESAPAEITIDDFAKLDLRVAKVLSAEKIEGADKLYKLQVDMGSEQRQIVSGIAKHYTPEELVGKNVVVIANLKPVKLRGVDSYGMILAAADDKTLKVCTLDGDMPAGTQVR